MKNALRSVRDVILLVLLLPLLLLVFACYLLTFPITFFRYRRSPYYKDTGEKCKLWGLTDYVRLYNVIKKNGLPMTYLRAKEVPLTGYGYWILGNAAVTFGYEPEYDEQTEAWLSKQEDEEGEPSAPRPLWEAYLEECNSLPGGEGCGFVYLLVDKADVPESAVLSFDTYRIVPYSPKDPLPALEEILKAENIPSEV